MEPNSRLAANAYRMLAELQESSGKSATSKIVGGENPDFGGMVTDVVSQFTQQAKVTDAQTQGLAAGKSDLIDVVTAVSQTQLAMETIVSVRDQVIAAYEKIMQMPI